MNWFSGFMPLLYLYLSVYITRFCGLQAANYCNFSSSIQQIANWITSCFSYFPTSILCSFYNHYLYANFHSPFKTRILNNVCIQIRHEDYAVTDLLSNQPSSSHSVAILLSNSHFSSMVSSSTRPFNALCYSRVLTCSFGCLLFLSTGGENLVSTHLVYQKTGDLGVFEWLRQEQQQWRKIGENWYRKKCHLSNTIKTHHSFLHFRKATEAPRQFLLISFCNRNTTLIAMILDTFFFLCFSPLFSWQQWEVRISSKQLLAHILLLITWLQLPWQKQTGTNLGALV